MCAWLPAIVNADPHEEIRGALQRKKLSKVYGEYELQAEAQEFATENTMDSTQRAAFLAVPLARFLLFALNRD